MMMQSEEGHAMRSLICDDQGKQQLHEKPHEIFDIDYFSDLVQQEAGSSNWVYQEMWNYFQKKFPHYTLDDMKRHWKHSRSHVLEVYCSEQSQLTRQGETLGMTTFRFGLRHGDLATFSGRCRLYDLIWQIRPHHIWVSPKCGPWSR